MEIKQRSPDELKPFDKNPKEHPEEQVDKLVDSIEEFGWTNPILTVKTDDSENLIVAGHGRLKAAKRLELESVPTIDLEMSYEEAKAYNLADNKLAELPGWNDEALAELLEDVDDSPVDIELTGFSEDEVSALIGEEIIEDEFVPPEVVEPRCERGQVWRLGDHRLMCGDATSERNVEELMDGNKADMVLTDPPYGVNIVNSKEQIVGDGLETTNIGNVGVPGESPDGKKEIKPNKYKEIEGDTEPFDPTHLLELGKKLIIFGANNFAQKLPENSHWLVWDKKTKNDKSKTYEKSGTFFGDAELLWTNIKRKSVKVYRYLWVGLLKEGSETKRKHPTQKPVGLLGDIIRDYTENNDNILDPYGGSGSTLIACEQLDRRCYMMEIDPEYCEVIMQRWEEFTGEKSELRRT